MSSQWAMGEVVGRREEEVKVVQRGESPLWRGTVRRRRREKLWMTRLASLWVDSSILEDGNDEIYDNDNDDYYDD